MTTFPFDDLHGFKDFVVFVRMCAPDNFPDRDGALASEPWTLELAFQGLRKGIADAISEKGERDEFSESSELIEEAYRCYDSGDKPGGFRALDDVRRILRRIKTK